MERINPFISNLLLILALAVSQAYAGETRQMYRSTRAMGMGNAFTAVADDEEAIFLNPAAMARNEGTKFNMIAADITGSSDWVSTLQTGTSGLGNLSGDTLNIIMGKNIYAQGTVAPSLMMSNLGLAFLVDGQFALRAENMAFPRIQFGYQSTNGIQLSYGMSVYKHSGRNSDEMDVGIGLKWMFRRGGYRLIPITTLLNVDRSSLGPIIGQYGSGYGGDVGFQYIRHLHEHWDVSAAATYLDVGDTNFGEGPDPQKGNITLGMSATFKLSAIRAIASYDYKNLMDDTDPRKKSHFGLDMGLSFASILLGFNQVYYTYGLQAKFWMVKAAFASYSEEQGSFAFQDPERRYMGHIQLTFDL